MKKTHRILAVVACLSLFAAMAMGSGSFSTETKDVVAVEEAVASAAAQAAEAPAAAPDTQEAPAETAQEAPAETAPEAAEPAEAPAEEVPAEAAAPAGITIQEQVLLDQDGIRITATEYTTDSIWGDGVKLLIENNSDTDYTIGCDALIVNDYMISDLFVAEVAAGKKANETLDLSSSELEAAGISNVGKIEVYFHAYNADYDWIFSGAYAEIQTSEYANMASEPNDAGMELYNENGIRIVGKTVDENSFWGTAILLYCENYSGMNVGINVDDMSINGFMITPIFSTTLYDGKKAIDEITLFSSDLEENGIETIEEVELKFHIYDAESYETIADSEPITFGAQ